MRNFFYLIIITAIIGIFLKFYFKSDSHSLNLDIDIKQLSESTIDSILFDDLYQNKAFSAYLGYNYNKIEVLFDEKPFSDMQSKNYGYGILYFKRYFEFTAARDLICEINNNLFNNPLLERYVMLPLISSYDENENVDYLFKDFTKIAQSLYGRNELIEKKYNREPDEIFSGSFKINNPYCSKSTNKSCSNDEECGDGVCIDSEYYDIYNPAYYEFHAVQYLSSSIENLNEYLYNSKNNDRKLSAAIKLAILYAKSNNIDKMERVYREYLSIKKLINILNVSEGELPLIDFLDIEIVDLLIELEKNNLIKFSKAKYCAKNIRDLELNKLYLYKRELNNLKQIGAMPTYSCNDIENVFLSSEIMLSLSEIHYLNNNISTSEDIMYEFWSDCPLSLDPRLDWIYSNYSNTLLRSFRLSIWHGSLIPQFNKFFREQFVDELYADKRFESLNMAIKSWILATISFSIK